MGQAEVTSTSAGKAPTVQGQLRPRLRGPCQQPPSLGHPDPSQQEGRL